MSATAATLVSQEQFHNLGTKVAVLERDSEQFKTIIEKLDTTIEKISQVANDIAKVLAVHEQRLMQKERTDGDMLDSIGQLRIDLKTIQSGLEDKIDETNKRVTKLERLSYLVIGAAALVGFLIDKFL